MSDNSVTSDSVFRIMSVSKNIAMLSALVLGNHPNSHMTLDTALREVLPSFRLPPLDWNSGGSEITLRMLASHTAGIPRESYSTGFNMVRATGRADAATIGAAWAAASAEQVIEGIGDRQLMFAPGERAACKFGLQRIERMQNQNTHHDQIPMLASLCSAVSRDDFHPTSIN